MALEGSYTFAGIGAAEAKDRESENRSGVPALGSGLTALLSAPARRTTGVRVMNQGSADALIALAHGNKSKTVAAELLIASRVSSTVYRGKLQFGAITPKSVTITAAAGPSPLTDDGLGNLIDAALVVRGTINYRTGNFQFTASAPITEPVTIAYTHTDWTQFSSAVQTTTKAAAAYPFTMASTFGRVVPGTVTMTDGAVTFVDDGKGNMVETTGGIAVVRGTFDYALGIAVITGGTAPFGGTVTMTYKFNPFASLLVKGGGFQGVPLLSDAIPELGSQVYAAGVGGETKVALLGVTRDASLSTNIVAWFAHHVDESYRVEQINSGFPPGGALNDPRTADADD